MFVLTYYEKVDPVKKLVYYDKMVEAYNSQMCIRDRVTHSVSKTPMITEVLQEQKLQR